MIKVIDNTCMKNSVKFEELKPGEVFYTLFSDEPYIKTDSITTEKAIKLCNGSWCNVDNDSLVIPYKKTELHIEK